MLKSVILGVLLGIALFTIHPWGKWVFAAAVFVTLAYEVYAAVAELRAEAEAREEMRAFFASVTHEELNERRVRMGLPTVDRMDGES